MQEITLWVELYKNTAITLFQCENCLAKTNTPDEFCCNKQMKKIQFIAPLTFELYCNDTTFERSEALDIKTIYSKRNSLHQIEFPSNTNPPVNFRRELTKIYYYILFKKFDDCKIIFDIMPYHESDRELLKSYLLKHFEDLKEAEKQIKILFKEDQPYAPGYNQYK